MKSSGRIARVGVILLGGLMLAGCGAGEVSAADAERTRQSFSDENLKQARARHGIAEKPIPDSRSGANDGGR